MRSNAPGTPQTLTRNRLWATFIRMMIGRTGAIALLLVILVGCGSTPKTNSAERAPGDVRATWVVRHLLTSQASVDRVVREASAGEINTLMVQVRGRGDAWYQGGIEPVAHPLRSTTFDPLEAIIEAAHRAGISVHAWVNVNLVYNPARPHNDPRHLVNRHPEWLCAPDSIARELVRLPPGHRSFREKLLSHVEAHAGAVEGLYADPLNPAYRDHVARVCRDIVSRYDVDGIHLDYIRYASASWGYSRFALELLRVEVDRELSAQDRADMAARVRADPLVYSRRYPVRWATLRRAAIDETVQSVSSSIRAVRPSISLSAAVIPDISEARDVRLQAWPGWIKRGWVDVICPMNYARADERALFDERARASVAAARPGSVWMGIGSWRLTVSESIDRARFSRRLGAAGVVLFSHGALQGIPEAFDALRGMREVTPERF